MGSVPDSASPSWISIWTYIRDWPLTLKTILLVAFMPARCISELHAIREPFLCGFDPVILPFIVPKILFCHPIWPVHRILLRHFFPNWMWEDVYRSDALFVFYSGQNSWQWALKATLGLWFLLAILEAYKLKQITHLPFIRAHSTRTLATSWAERARPTSEQIYKAATWSTFIRLYRMDLLSNQDPPLDVKFFRQSGSILIW